MMIPPFPGDPVWAPEGNRGVRGTVERVEVTGGRRRVVVILPSGFRARYRLDQISYRYEKGERDDVSR